MNILYPLEAFHNFHLWILVTNGGMIGARLKPGAKPEGSMFPSPTELNYFLEVANTSNISRAAERLGISQPTLSLAIRRLEDSVGTPLLIRTKAGVQLTKGGQKLVSRARNLLQEWEKVRSEAVTDDDKISGIYTIGCHPSVGIYSLGFLAGLLQRNPGLEVKLCHGLSRKITEDVISFKVDFGIVVNPVRHPDLVIRPLLKDEVGFWVASAPTPTQNPYSGAGVLICDPELLQTQSLMKQLSERKAKFARTITSSNLEVITSLVADGAGVGILPGLVAERFRGLGLKRLPELPKFQDRICLVYRADAQSTATGRFIAKEIETSFHQEKNRSPQDRALV